MGFPIPYAGVLPKLLFTAAISIAALKDLCSPLLEFLGLSSFMASHGHIINQLSHSDLQPDLDPLSPASEPEHYGWYFNSHLHMPSDPSLLLRRSAFSEALQASLPVLRFGSSSLQPASSVGPLLSSSLQSSSSSLPPLSSSSSSSFSSLQVQTQELYTVQLRCSTTVLSAPASSPASLSASPTLPSSSSSSTSFSSCSSLSSSSMLSSLVKSDDQHENMRSCGSAATTCNTILECSVCLCEFQREQEVREMPVCNHVFHKDCIDGWILHNHHTCPLCRASILTPTMALQEMLREQERISHQLTAWFTNYNMQEEEEEEEEEETYYTHHDHQHQSFYFTLQRQPAAAGY